ncbi:MULTISPECIES: tripartite tricarboxylate transporter TctB family protein [unclassified Paenibacillus]|uniref:tripartite tricarboxylate transporter TctB family protein n=1 Tax=unclassified Paenibacillus TaxID=185978 RepID=UPI001AE3E7D0|nr:MULTISPECIES: tripartite tricarboxylate transporter TctB family protein [unclassified Paenibacillus]MBP1154983.1 hypothetical protein [Paenibacillus sp. PvP091]MBP1169633.1 hypothetical protein [Paenibacillus sp. PvR098]MBP2440661.1 hypothetical protein [Paenibacillus sp. PvP052]
MKMAAKKNAGELGICIGMLLLAVLFIALADFKQTVNPLDPGPALFPRLTGAFTIFFCILQMITSLRDKADPEEKPEEDGAAGKLKVLYVLGTLAMTIVYILLFEVVKYILLTGVFLVAVMLLLGIRKWTVLIGTGVIYALVSYYLYGKVLLVPLT